MQFATLAFAVVFATAYLLDHYGPFTRFFDRFDQLVLSGVNVLGGDVPSVCEQFVDPILESLQTLVVLLRDTLGEVLRKWIESRGTSWNFLTKQ
ncbi:hypothetical protein [Natronorubrum sp. A-ect3]|uniref:hypothetical protein n=1 Tax=Natronorubrum sp. A-ect3 TaxID=3242698 RepID=UPI00359DDCB9